jgi:SHS2 domain-containing protein
MKYKFLSHTADIKFRAFGKTLNEVFENSGLAMVHVFYDKTIKYSKIKKINVKGKDLESLMYNFLEELLFLIDAGGFLPGKIKVNIDKDKKILSSELAGDNIKDYKVRPDVKAITYNDMFVKKIKNKFVAQVVLDV